MGTGGGVVGSNTAPSVFASLARGAEAALAQSASRGWALGGTVDAGTDPSYPLPGTYQPVPGLLEFDMRTLAFRNLTSPEMISALGGPHRSTVQGAVGQYIGGWGAREEKRQGGGEGEDGLVFFMAGTRPGVIPYVTSSTEYIDFGNLSIYEPATGRWFWQKATGDVPVGRMHTCTASTSGRTGSTEIFLFGGYNERLNTTFDDVHILTIPGFNWFRVNPSSTPTPRCWHACVTAGKGRRQMIAVGGVRPEFRWPRIWTDRDSLPQGIGVLDMTSLTWRDSFDASLPEYEQPDVVKQWYAGSGLSFVPWSSNEVKTLFLDGYAARQRAFNEGRDPAATPNSTSSDTGNPDDSMRDADRSAPVATIVGAVLGSVAFLVLCVLLLCVCYRKRQRRYAAQLAAEEEERAVVAMRRAGTGELDVENNHAELHGSSVTRHELPAREEVTKPASYPPAELDGEREKWPVLTSSSERNGKRE